MGSPRTVGSAPGASPLTERGRTVGRRVAACGGGLRGVLLLVVLALSACTRGGGPPPLPVVGHVDLERYQGTWYEIARLPNWFERGCLHSYAEYRLTGPGTLAITNTCISAEGNRRVAQGLATVADPVTNARLEVEFDNWISRLIPGLTRGRYWILDLDPAYRTVLVGEPGRDYLWILAREKSVPPETYGRLVQRAGALGFDTARLVVPQR
ncbi:apolipoprotein D and lipocalin family protein [Thioalbus denitrificans]|uniref:Outer membrane lipoprotein Blc n=1 Tax=Thioalbus denitrificans TaxID=547122 RepID=A0A369BWI2_9GAMM|nr:apolipoprotein D and lipocalin family protein [Thioalbus denitrificans]